MSAATARWDEARPEDDSEVRALLRACPMDGLIQVALTREPDAAQSASIEGSRHRTFVVRAEAGLLGMGARSVRDVWLAGEPVKLGYLGQLRARPGAMGPRRLMEGYRYFERAHQPDELAFDLTAIAEDNAPARRLLERGLRGLPRYEPIATLETLVVATGGRAPTDVKAAERTDGERILAFVDASTRSYALGPRWDAVGSLPALSTEDFLTVEASGQLVGAAAIWDQRAFKQVVIAGYRPWLRVVRPIVNLGLRVRGEPALPPAGSALRMAYLSHLAVAGHDPTVAEAIVRAARARAKQRGLDTLAFALADDHPLLSSLVRTFAPRRYRSVIYAVSWASRPVDAATLTALRDGLVHVEAATL